MSQIAIKNITFSYEGNYTNVFEDASISFDTAWKLGFVGRNGRGKTTLLRLLAGELSPNRGHIQSPVQFSSFPFIVEQPEGLTLDLFEQLCPDHQPWEWQRELHMLEMDDDVLYRPYSTLSHGERTKIQLAALFVREDRFLLIDEPTNHLDTHAREVLSNYLNRKTGFILVSHDRQFLDGCVDHILAINKADIEVIRGNFTTWFSNRERQDAFEMDENAKLIKEIGHLQQAAKRTAGWSDQIEATKIGQGVYDRGAVGHKAAKMMKRAKAIENRRETAIAEKEKLLKNIEYYSPLKIHPLVHHAKAYAQVENASVQYGDAPVFSDVSFTISAGDRVALTGKNGCGKSSLLKLLVGEDIPYAGVVKLASGLTLSYVPQDASFLKGNLSDYARECKIDESLFKTILRKLDFMRVQFEKDMRDFSAGQRKKVLIARSLSEQAHLYLWDEPLNYIDVLSRIQIETLIMAHEPTMVFVEHDRAFVEKVSTKIVTL
ncbi:ABC-F type ribosomal protection protein [Christensenellaceae bacterium OttesenSCG-928-M15]|nr:ABC-F type ribosomal protection protein [Christensenellaceae bacterium OttesenSCG-928-M15]